MKLSNWMGPAVIAAGALSIPLSSAQAADLEFYFPVGVNAPAVETIQGLVDTWAAQNPQHSVKAVYAGNYEETTTKALTAAQAGNAPHVAVLLAADLFSLIEEDVVLPYTEISNTAEDQAWIDGFYSGFMADTVYNGETYSIPFQRSTPVLYYNKDAFREAGLDPENPPTTWDEMIEQGKQLVIKDDNGNVTRWGTRIPTLGLGGAWLFGGMVISGGDKLSTESGTEARIDTAAAADSLQFLLDLSTEGVMQSGGISWGDTPKAFIEGQTASMWTSTGNLTFVTNNAEFEWGVSFLPGNDGPGAPTGGGNFYIFKDSTQEEREAALDFVKFMTSPDSAATWAIATGYVAPRADTWETDAMKAYVAERPQALVARDQLQHAYREFATFQRQRVTRFLVEAIESTIGGSTEPKEALAAAQERANEVLADYK